jgi:MFS-type transporter involved in bile tolerance (Atg22 family)
MANTNKAFGLRPLAKLGSNVNNNGDTQYRIVSNTTDAIFQGDTVTLSGGYVVKATPGAANILGVFLGCQYTDPTTKKTTFKNYYPGAVVADDIVATVVDDPNALFLVQASGVAAVTCVGKNADLVQTAAGSTTTGVSGLELSTGTLGTSADLNVKVVGISSVPGEGDVTSAYANLIVKINEHLYSAATAGV